MENDGWICSCGNWIWSTKVRCECCGQTFEDNNLRLEKNKDQTLKN